MDDLNHVVNFLLSVLLMVILGRSFLFVYVRVHHVHHYASTLMLCKSDMSVLHMQWWEVFYNLGNIQVECYHIYKLLQ